MEMFCIYVCFKYSFKEYYSVIITTLRSDVLSDAVFSMDVYEEHSYNSHLCICISVCMCVFVCVSISVYMYIFSFFNFLYYVVILCIVMLHHFMHIARPKEE